MKPLTAQLPGIKAHVEVHGRDHDHVKGPRCRSDPLTQVPSEGRGRPLETSTEILPSWVPSQRLVRCTAKWHGRAVERTTGLDSSSRGVGSLLSTLEVSLATAVHLSRYHRFWLVPAASGRSPALHENSFDLLELGWYLQNCRVLITGLGIGTQWRFEPGWATLPVP